MKKILMTALLLTSVSFAGQAMAAMGGGDCEKEGGCSCTCDFQWTPYDPPQYDGEDGPELGSCNIMYCVNEDGGSLNASVNGNVLPYTNPNGQSYEACDQTAGGITPGGYSSPCEAVDQSPYPDEPEPDVKIKK